MSQRSRRRPLVLALAVALCLAPLGASAAGRPLPPARAALNAAGPRDWLRAVLTLWLPSLASIASKEGCTIDPNGLCGGKGTARPAGPTGENGCTIDPNGQCAVAPTTEGGCTIDPNGHCAPDH